MDEKEKPAAKKGARYRVLVGTIVSGVAPGAVSVSANSEEPFVTLAPDEAEPLLATGEIELAP